MILIEYARHGIAVSDFHLEERIADIKECVEKPEWYYRSYATENIFARVRLEIGKGNIPYTSVKFLFNHEELLPNEYGALLNWPNGFCDSVVNINEQILRTSLDKYKEKRETHNRNNS